QSFSQHATHVPKSLPRIAPGGSTIPLLERAVQCRVARVEPSPPLAATPGPVCSRRRRRPARREYGHSSHAVLRTRRGAPARWLSPGCSRGYTLAGTAQKGFVLPMLTV